MRPVTHTLDLTAARPAQAETWASRSLVGLTRARIAERLVEAGLVDPRKARMRASQVWRWVYHYGVRSFDAMSDIAKELRTGLAATFTLDRPAITERQVSVDGTRKYLIRMGPGIEVEAVFIPDVGRAGALCVSSQVGCTLTCTFCHTGTQRLVRNLTAQEIVAQVVVARDDLDEWPTRERPLNDGDRCLTNIVFMGMGEPLYNLDHVADALDVISDGDGLSISRRRITVSTSGVVPEIGPLGARTNAMLAISLHATNDALRDELVPLNRKYPLAALVNAVRAYPGLNNSRRVTWEYVMLAGVNDSPAEARALIRLIEGIPSKINLIPFNP